MLSRVRSLVFPHHFQGFFDDGPHLGGAGCLLHIKYGADVQAANRGVGIKGAGCPVFVKDVSQPPCVFGEIFEIDGTVFDEGDGLAVTLHRHHDIETGLSYLPDRLLKFTVSRLHHCVGEAQLSHEINQLLHAL